LTPRPLWRVFPWSRSAADGERFSRGFLPAAGQGTGRFDLPGSARGVLYLAECPQHAVAERLQRFRNSSRALGAADLTEWGHPLAVVEVGLADEAWDGIADLCDPSVLATHGFDVDHPPLRDRRRTQAMASGIHAAGAAGLRWWSAFWGEWHTVVVFLDRLQAGSLTYASPAVLEPGDPLVREVAALLDIG
jgi:hypothetical protein